MGSKGNQNAAGVYRRPNCLLTDEQVREARQIWSTKTDRTSPPHVRELAERYGVHRNTLWQAVTYKTYGWVE